MKLVDTSVRRPIGVLMIVLAVIALGFVSLKNLAVDLFPDIDLPVVVVATSYDGASPQEVENLVSRPLESSLSTIQGLDTIQSQSSPGASLVVMLFDWGVNLDSAINEVREKVDQVEGFLPEGAKKPTVLRFDPQQIPVMYVGLSGLEPEKLQQIAEDVVQPHFERMTGVASVTIMGGKEREIQVELNRAALNQYGIVPSTVAQSLAGENQDISAGVLEKGVQELQIRVVGQFASVADIENTLVPLPGGGHVKIRDIAEVKDSFKEMSTISKVNNEPALVLSVLKNSDANTVKVADEIYKAIDELQKLLPQGIALSIVFDTSTFIRDAMGNVVDNMVLGGVLSVIILMLFLRSVRAVLVISVSIPIAIISTFTLMYFTGETLNMLSMGGLALGIGMMVDSSIVILENVFSYRQRGASLIEAATKGASELGSAVIASTTTSLVVFLPIVFVQGMASELFTPLALTVSFSLLASMIVALTLVPTLASKWLTRVKDAEQSSRWFDRVFNKLLAAYKRALAWALRHRKTTVGVTFLAIVGSLILVPFIGAEFIPQSDQGQVEIAVRTQSGSTLNETAKIAARIEEQLQPYMPIIETNYLYIGGNTNSVSSPATNMATFTIQLVKPSERELTTSQFIQEVDEKLSGIAGAEITVRDINSSMSAGSPVQIQISGSELEVLEEIAQQVEWLIADIPGIRNVENSMSESRPELQVQIDREMAARYGLTSTQIMSELSMAFNGQVATRYREDGSEIDVKVLLPEDERTEIRDLENAFIQTANGHLIPLSAVAQLEQVQGPTQISRENQQRQINVTADIAGRDLGSVINEVNVRLASLNLPDGYRINMGGQASDMAESFADLAVALVFSIFLVYVVMAVQFESLVHPFVIMFSMPTMFVGVMLGLFLTGTPLSVPAFIGIIMLAGIVVNNAIILVDYVNTLRSRNMERDEAILAAGPQRLRPIMMTTLTTVLGMLPLALGIGEGTESQAPLAIVIIFGLSVSSVFTLLLVPVMYTIMDDMPHWTRRFFKRLFFWKRQSPRSVESAQ